MEELAGTVWQWEQSKLKGDQNVTVADPTRYLIEFLAGGRLAVKADCNQVRGMYTTDGSTLTIRLGPSTLVACPPDSQAREFLSELAEVNTFLVEADRLALGLAQGGSAMLFAGSSPIALADTSWRVTGINNGKQAVASVIIGTTVTLNFGADGQVNGSAGCNSYRGPYETTGDQIKTGPLGATRKMCGGPEGVMAQEAQFLAALQAGTTFKITGDRLVIRDAAGAMQVTAAQ